MVNKYDELRKYPSGSLFKAAVINLFEKKSVRLTASAIAVVVSLFAMDIVSQYYGRAFWWANCLFNLPFFIMFTAGTGGFISNIGKFGMRKFIAASTASAAALWIIMAVYNVLAFAYLPIDWSLCSWGIGLELLRHILLPVVSLVVVFSVMISFRRKNNS